MRKVGLTACFCLLASIVSVNRTPAQLGPPTAKPGCDGTIARTAKCPFPSALPPGAVEATMCLSVVGYGPCNISIAWKEAQFVCGAVEPTGDPKMHRDLCKDSSYLDECTHTIRCNGKLVREKNADGSETVWTKCTQDGDPTIDWRYLKATLTEPKCEPMPGILR